MGRTVRMEKSSGPLPDPNDSAFRCLEGLLVSKSRVVETTTYAFVTSSEDFINFIIVFGKRLAGDAGETPITHRNGPHNPKRCPAVATRSRQRVGNAAAQTCKQLRRILVRVSLD